MTQSTIHNSTTFITITNNDGGPCPNHNGIESNKPQPPQRRGFLSRFRRRRRPITEDNNNSTKKKNNTNNNKNGDDETNTLTTYNDEDELTLTDDEVSFSSSFDEIDQLLALPVVTSSVLDNNSANNHYNNSTVVVTPTYYENTKEILLPPKSRPRPIDQCLKLLSAKDLDQNRVGLQRLMMFTLDRSVTTGTGVTYEYPKKQSHEDNKEDEEEKSRDLSDVLVFGSDGYGMMHTPGERLRYIFATMICNSPHEDIQYNYDDDNDESDDDEDDDEDDYEKYDHTYFDDDLDEKEALFDWILEDNAKETEAKAVDHTTHNNLERQQQQHNDNDNGKKAVDTDTDTTTTESSNNTATSNDYTTTNDSRNTEPQSQSQTSYHSEGKGDGILHNHALRVLANALVKVSSTMNRQQQQQQQTRRIPVEGSVWKNIIRCLVTNIQNVTTTTTTATQSTMIGAGYSLRILRLLHTIHPEVIVPLLRSRTVLPQLFCVQEYGQIHHVSMIYTEASYLLQQAV